MYQPATSAPRASKTGLRRLLFGYSCLLLVCAGATIASLQAARALVRQREIEIRFALGAQQRHVISQLLTENALLAAFGATGAIAIGRLAREALRRWSASTPDLQFNSDIQSTVAAVVLASAASLFFGVLPTLRRARAGYRPVKRRRGLLGFQSGVSCFFAVIGVILTQSVWRRLEPQVAFPIKQIIEVSPSSGRHPFRDLPPALARLKIGRRHFLSYPWAQAVGLWRTQNDGRFIWLNRVAPSYFAFMDCQLVRGRLLDPSEPDTVVVSQIAARELWPHLDPIGQQLYAETWNGGRRFTVVGVVSDTGESGLAIIDRKLAGDAFALYRMRIYAEPRFWPERRKQ